MSRVVRGCVAIAIAAGALMITGVGQAAPVDGGSGQAVASAAIAEPSITGRVTTTGGAGVSNVTVFVTPLGPGFPSLPVMTSADGSYAISGLLDGSYRIRFSPFFASNLIAEYYDDASSVAAATPVTVVSSATTSGIDAELELGGGISGRVTGPSGAPVTGVNVQASRPGGGFASVATGADGAYTLAGLAVGVYTVRYLPPFGSGLVGEYFDDAVAQSMADPVAVTAGATTAGIDAQLEAAGAISGRVIDESGAPLANFSVTARSTSLGPTEFGGSNATTDADGRYTIGGLVGDDYLVQFQVRAGSGLLPEFYDDAPDSSTATLVNVTAGATTTGIDAALERGGTVSGRITDGTGAPVPDVYVFATRIGIFAGNDGFTDEDGVYTLDGLPSGEYRMLFTGTFERGLFGEYYDDVATPERATPVLVTAGSATTGIDAVLEPGGSISGRVTDGAGAPIPDVTVVVQDVDGLEASASTDADGSYEIVGLPKGNYLVRFEDAERVVEYYDDVPTAEQATPVRVVGGADTAGIDAVLMPDVAPPAAPTGVMAVAGHRRAVVSWSAPDGDGGAPITGYVVTASPGGATCASASSSCVVDGLTNGTAYTFTVSASNATGTGPSSTPSNSVIPQVSVPDRPAELAAEVAPADGVGSGQVRLTWSPPSSDGGSAITDYVIERSIDGVAWETVRDGRSTTAGATLSRLDDGTAYTFRVAARNAIGISPASDLVTVTPRWIPSKPQALEAAVAPTPGVGSGQVRLTWSPPRSTRGAAITDYLVELSLDGSTWIAVADGISDATEATISGLVNGTTYRFRVTAVNVVGAGPPSGTVRARPR